MQALWEKLRTGTIRAQELQSSLPHLSSEGQARAKQVVKAKEPKVRAIRQTPRFVARCALTFWLAWETAKQHPRKLAQNERYAFWGFLFWMLFSWDQNPYGSFGQDAKVLAMQKTSTAMAFYFALLSLFTIVLMRMKERERAKYDKL